MRLSVTTKREAWHFGSHLYIVGIGMDATLMATDEDFAKALASDLRWGVDWVLVAADSPTDAESIYAAYKASEPEHWLLRYSLGSAVLYESRGAITPYREDSL